MLLSASSTTLARGDFGCTMRDGPAYMFTGRSGTFRSKSYTLEGNGITCATAEKWVRRLAKEPYKGLGKPVRHGPPGWRCLSSKLDRPLPGQEPPRVLAGTCQSPTKRSAFRWDPFVGDGVRVS